MKKTSLAIATASMMVALPLPTLAQQVTPDGTSGTRINRSENSVEIQGGKLRGSNLFHSFRDFSPAQLDLIFRFQGNHDTLNIINRVTGGSSSFIDGGISAAGNANVVNVFLLNPNGITFGQNASLNITGSFLATTADSLVFEDDSVFSVTQEEPVITIERPVAIEWNGNFLGRIVLDGSQLDSAPGQTIALVGGNVEIDGGSNRFGLFAPGGHIEIGSVVNGRVDLETAENGWRFNYSNAEELGTIEISEASLATTDLDGFSPSGNIDLHGEEIAISDSDIFSSGDFGSSGGDINIEARSSFILSRTQLDSGTFDSGTGGNVKIEAQEFTLRDFSLVSAASQGGGEAGEIIISVTDNLVIDNSIVGVQNLEAGGNAGSISIEAGNLRLTNNSAITSASRSGDFGNIFINTAQLRLDNSEISALAVQDSNGGNIIIDAELILLLDSSITASADRGDGGNIRITTSDIFTDPDSQIVATSETGIDGTVEVETSVDSRTSQIEATVPEENPMLSSGCTTRGSSFVNVGTQGRVEAPTELLGTSPIIEDTSLPPSLNLEEIETIKRPGGAHLANIDGLLMWRGGSIDLEALGEPEISEDGTVAIYRQPPAEPTLPPNAWIINEEGNPEMVTVVGVCN